MDLSLAGKVVLVTGGNAGIGRAIASGFAQEGARVIIAARNSETGEQAAAELIREGAEAVFIQADVAQASQLASLFEQIKTRFGRLDCAVNNAGVEVAQKSFLDWTEEEWDKTHSINLKGVWLCMREEIALLRANGAEGGAIVNVSSVAGLVGFPALAPYVASKHGVLGLTKAAAVEFAKENIRVNSVCPGTIVTPMQQAAFEARPDLKELVMGLTPIGRGGTVEECVGGILWLCSAQASFTTGITVSIDGGWSQH
jgi:NAD(P)-dependent dehydrogenase (short-subunit alcohol dehydrogenase family)